MKKIRTEYPDGFPEHRIKYRIGNCFEPLGSPHHYILNPVNDTGIIETDVFHTIKRKWPFVYDFYANQPLLLGAVHFTPVMPDKTIVTMIVQHGEFDAINREQDFRYEVFRECLHKLLFITQAIGTYHMTKPRVHIPIFPWRYPLADWMVLAKIIDETIIAAKGTIYVYKQNWRI